MVIRDSLRAEDRANKDSIRTLNRNQRASFQKYGVVRYNAFKGMGGNLSFAYAMLDLSLIHICSSLPEDVQYAMYRTVTGIENVKIVRNAYAIEYDCINSLQLKPTLEFKKISGLFAGGQFNGSSGYEEAAVQGFMAGVNAVRKLKGQEPVVLDRSQAYIGVLIDDLVTKENHEDVYKRQGRSQRFFRPKRRGSD